jgi:hypothetical protein
MPIVLLLILVAVFLIPVVFVMALAGMFRPSSPPLTPQQDLAASEGGWCGVTLTVLIILCLLAICGLLAH